MAVEPNPAKRWLTAGVLVLLVALVVLPQPRHWLGGRLWGMLMKMHGGHAGQSMRSLHSK